MNISQLIQDAKRDPSLCSNINVADLLGSNSEFLENETLDSISRAIFENISSLPIPRQLLSEYCSKLVGYRFVDEIYQLHKGKHVRWIRISNPNRMLVGGTVVDVRFVDEGVNILCRLPSGRFMQYRFDQCITFQKLTDDEQLMLAVSSA
jgi:hypothetical protein